MVRARPFSAPVRALAIDDAARLASWWKHEQVRGCPSQSRVAESVLALMKHVGTTDVFVYVEKQASVFELNFERERRA